MNEREFDDLLQYAWFVTQPNSYFGLCPTCLKPPLHVNIGMGSMSVHDKDSSDDTGGPPLTVFKEILKAEQLVVSIGTENWCFCREHKVKWCIGSGLFSLLEDDTEEKQLEYLSKIGWYAFREVNPFYRARKEDLFK